MKISLCFVYLHKTIIAFLNFLRLSFVWWWQLTFYYFHTCTLASDTNSPGLSMATSFKAVHLQASFTRGVEFPSSWRWCKSFKSSVAGWQWWAAQVFFFDAPPNRIHALYFPSKVAPWLLLLVTFRCESWCLSRMHHILKRNPGFWTAVVCSFLHQLMWGQKDMSPPF